MTIENKVRSVAIIGGGPAGIASLYELLHTLKDGRSIVGDDHHNFEDLLAFDKVTLFERNAHTGGQWDLETAGKDERDPLLPQLKGDFNLASEIFEKVEIPKNLSSEFTYVKPLKTASSAPVRWTASGVYDGLFTNIGEKYMTFSYHEHSWKDNDTKDVLKQLLSYRRVGEYLDDVITTNKLEEHIRLNSSVERVSKKDDKWEIVIRQSKEGEDAWYVEFYDAVIIANGRTIPHVPNFDGLSKFKANNPHIYISHTKSIPNPVFLRKREKVLFIGGSISTVDLIQYCFPRTYEPETVFLSRTKINSDRAEWVDHLSYSRGIINKPEIRKFHANGDIEFTDGSVESGFDTVILGTGYHTYFPFIDPITSSQHLTDFYLQIFSIDDPTLALVGNNDLPLLFQRDEAIAASIAGVWSGYRALPDKEKQLAWNAKPPFPFRFWNIKQYYIDYLLEKYAPSGRPNPLSTPDKKDHVREFAEAFGTLQDIFYGLKDGRYKVEDTL